MRSPSSAAHLRRGRLCYLRRYIQVSANILFGLGFEEGGGGLWCGGAIAGGVVEWIHLIVKLLIDNYLIVNMSALGAWNNRYEGGPCYAACMETFVLYVC